jgi:toxin FitB
MSGIVADLLLDSDVFIDHLRGHRRLEVGKGDAAYYSVVTRCELFAGRSAIEEVIDRLLGSHNEIGVDRRIAEDAGRLRRSHPIRTPDALIAATALAHGLTLWTRNVRDFAGIRGLAVVNPGESPA